MSEVQTASERITEEVTSWPGVTAGPGRRGEFAFKVGGREVGHLHGDRSAHFGFPKAVWREHRDSSRLAEPMHRFTCAPAGIGMPCISTSWFVVRGTLTRGVS